MLYLDYAKQTEDGYIMNFFANSVEDLEDISEGKEFVTKNGTNYGVPAPQSVVTITNKDGEKTTYLMGEDGNWIPGVVNPTDYYTKKQADEKFANKDSVGSKKYIHETKCRISGDSAKMSLFVTLYLDTETEIRNMPTFKSFLDDDRDYAITGNYTSGDGAYRSLCYITFNYSSDDWEIHLSDGTYVLLGAVSGRIIFSDVITEI